MRGSCPDGGGDVVKVEEIGGKWYALRWTSWANSGSGRWLLTHGPYGTKQHAVTAISEERDLTHVPQLLPYRILAEADRLEALRVTAGYFRGFGLRPLWEEHSSRFIFEMREHARKLIGGGEQ